MVVKRIGLIFVVAVVAVIVIEGALSILRSRDITAIVSVDGPPVENLPTAEASAGATPDPAAVTALIMSDKGNVLVEVGWVYRIGPKFARTLIRAEAINDKKEVVAAEEFTVDCGTATLQCEGSTILTLNFGRLTTATAEPVSGEWSAGEYTIRVTRAFAGLATAIVTEQTVIVFE